MTSLRVGLVALLSAWSVTGAACTLLSTFPRPAYDRPSPAGSRLIQPPLPQAVRHFALSPDRMRVAYSGDVSRAPHELFVATLGGQARKLAVVDPNIEQLQWSSDGGSLLYVEHEERVIPGEFDDWDIPRRELLAVQIKSLPVDGGEPRTVLTLPPSARGLRFQVQPLHQALILAVPEMGNGRHVVTLKRLVLESGVLRQVALPREYLMQFQVSPDGEYVAFNDSSADGALTVLQLQTGVTTALTATPSEHFMWMLSSQALLSVASEGRRHRLTTNAVTGDAAASRSIELELDSLQIDDASAISPNGKRLWAFGPDDSNLIITLDTGEVTRLESFGFIQGWLDDETVMGIYRGGHYVVPVPANSPQASIAP